MFFEKQRQLVKLLPNRLHTEKLFWCRDARAVYVNGSGALQWADCGLSAAPTAYNDRLSCLTLRGTPLVSRQSPGCPTCESLLAAGWGLNRADCPELEAVRETLNGGFIRLEDAVSALAPVLGLLPAGLYVLADGEAYPADGSGRFFWDVPDELTAYAATAMVELTDEDYDFKLINSAPVFLYPTQPHSRLDETRVSFYMERRERGPRAIALHLGEGMSLLLDGHHKAAAAARTGRTLACVTIFPLDGYRYRPLASGGRMKREAAFFGPLEIPVGELPAKWLPKEENLCQRGEGTQFSPGRLADRELPEIYRAAGAQYPTAKEQALMTAAETGDLSDQDLEKWLEHPREHRPRLRGALVALRAAGDPRLKSVALRCAAIPDRDSSLREEAFRVLAGMRGDPEAEAFFIQYFIQLDEDHGSDLLTKIAHTFWS